MVVVGGYHGFSAVFSLMFEMLSSHALTCARISIPFVVATYLELI